MSKDVDMVHWRSVSNMTGPVCREGRPSRNASFTSEETWTSELTKVTCPGCLAWLSRDEQGRIPLGPAGIFIQPPPGFDPVNKPAHYNQGKVECIDALETATMGLEGIEAVCTANVIKYMWRWKLKNGVEDLKKALWYLNKLIAKKLEKP